MKTRPHINLFNGKNKTLLRKKSFSPARIPFSPRDKKAFTHPFSSCRFGNISDVSGKVFLFLKSRNINGKFFYALRKKREETDFPKKKKTYEKTLTKENPGIIIKAD